MASKPSEGEAGASRGNLSREPIPGGLPRAAATTSGAGSPHRTCAGPNKRWHWAGSPTAQQLATSATISPSAPAKSDLRGRAHSMNCPGIGTSCSQNSQRRPPTRRNATPLRRLGARGQLLVRKAQGADQSIVFA